MAAIAYVDPGNFATNVLAGAKFGYALVRVVIVANLMRCSYRACPPKLGLRPVATRPELCRERFPRRVTLSLWAQAEVMAVAPTRAEFVGGVMALNLLFGIALLPAGMIATLTILQLGDGEPQALRGRDRRDAGSSLACLTCTRRFDGR